MNSLGTSAAALPHAPGAAGRSPERTVPAPSRAVATWLFACCALVFALVVVGGITRLTHSGLSITEWQPIVGVVPPLTAAQWQDTFAKYQATPEYAAVNRGMTLQQFQGIFWWEYAHRLLGRLVGVALLVPLAVFVARRALPRGLALPLLGIFVLGGAQGALGWYMVASGLVDDPRVSHFRLTAHLGLAFAIFASMFWLALSLVRPQRVALASGAQRATRRLAFALVALVFVMVLTGGMVAGLRAGLAYNTFPLMNGHWLPPEMLMLAPWWKNFLWNMATVQFDHRLVAWTLALLVPWLWWRIRHSDAPLRTGVGADLLLAALVVQIALGLATLLFRVPIPLAAAHQAGALLLFAAALNVAHSLR